MADEGRVALPPALAPRKAANRAAKKVAAKKAAAKKAPRKVAKKAPAKKAARPVAPAAVAAVEELENPPAVPDPWERGREAHRSLLAGKNWETVSMETGFEHVTECQLAVRGYLSFVHTMTGDDERQVAKRLELDRLDVIHESWWDMATRGRDRDAAAVILKVSERRAKLLELDTMSQRQGNAQTIIIPADENMAEQLRALALQGLQGAPAQDVVDAEVVDN